MYGYEVTEPRLRCVLPFEAEPAELCVLRRAVRGQLAGWGIPGLADKVQLAVTELATNVIKHVGEGTAATLVMEPGEGTLRVELHDKSHTLPKPAEPVSGDECGRGLQILDRLAKDWGTIVTTMGKAVWCELSSEGERQCLRVQRAESALERYRRDAGAVELRKVRTMMVLEDSATDLIADLLHWVAAQGGDPDGLLDRAQMHYEAETKAV